MNYTPSKDGVKRADIRITIRLSEDELAKVKVKAKEMGHDDWRRWLASELSLHLEGILIEEDGSYLQRYGKGDA